MSIYERKMKITYDFEWKDIEHIEQKVAYALHNYGMSCTSKYAWREPRDENYGFQTVTNTSYLYDVMKVNEDGNDTRVCTLDYSSQADNVVAGLLANLGIECFVLDRTEKDKTEKWIRPSGSYVYFSAEHMDGSSTLSPYPRLEYDDDLHMVVKCYEDYGDWCLEFNITYIRNTIEDRKATENKVVDVPLNDMRWAREIVESVLNTFIEGELNYTVDCETKILNEANYECTPETMQKVMNDD
jgi:hypothetical protein